MQDEFYKKMEKRKSDLLQENTELMNNGELYKFQLNCNYLAGIDFVMQNLYLLKKKDENLIYDRKKAIKK